MNSKLALQSLIAGVSLVLCSCGGGSSDGSSPRNVSGTWQGAITKVSDTCGGSAQNGTTRHVVTQNQGAVELNAGDGVQYLGNVVGEDGFSVDGTKAAASNCSDAVRIEYNDVNEDDDGTASVNVTTTRTCPGRAACEITYTGTAARSGGAVNTPVPGATVTPTSPVAGGCSAINPNPAADNYIGDGGCGISSVKYSVQQGNPDVILLEPFGANGATSFSAVSEGSAAANSTRTDLTILGVDGYSCSLACSAPSTFSVTCFKEGGTTCVEKF